MTKMVEVHHPDGHYSTHRDVEEVQWSSELGLTLTGAMQVNRNGFDLGRATIVYPTDSVRSYVVKDGALARFS